MITIIFYYHIILIIVIIFFKKFSPEQDESVCFGARQKISGESLERLLL